MLLQSEPEIDQHTADDHGTNRPPSSLLRIHPRLSTTPNVPTQTNPTQSNLIKTGSAAKAGGFYHNTGEGGISRFHLEGGGPLVWNVGTGYFGCRGEDGSFDADRFRENATRPNVKVCGAGRGGRRSLVHVFFANGAVVVNVRV